MPDARSGLFVNPELPSAYELLEWADRLLADIQAGIVSENAAMRWQDAYERFWDRVPLPKLATERDSPNP